MKRHFLTLFLASAAFATTVDRDGVAGIDKTFSAQTLHHGKLAIGVHTHIVDDAATLQNSTIEQDGVKSNLSDYFTLSSSIFLGLGLGPYSDISVALPLYYEK